MENTYIVACACGRSLRVRGEHLGQKVKCPHCGTIVPVPEHPPETGKIPEGATRTAGPEEVGKKCAICQTNIERDSPVVYCDRCMIPFHQNCWEENGGCATYACERAPKTAKLAGVQTAPHGWGDTKVCPACGKTIRSIALKCMHCEARFETADPMSREEYRQHKRIADKAGSARKTAVVLFVLSLLGCLAFIMLPVSIWWISSNRKTLARIPGEHMVLAYAAMVLSAFYTLAIVVLIAFD